MFFNVVTVNDANSELMTYVLNWSKRMLTCELVQKNVESRISDLCFQQVQKTVEL